MLYKTTTKRKNEYNNISNKKWCIHMKLKDS